MCPKTFKTHSDFDPVTPLFTKYGNKHSLSFEYFTYMFPLAALFADNFFASVTGLTGLKENLFPVLIH